MQTRKVFRALICILLIPLSACVVSSTKFNPVCDIELPEPFQRNTSQETKEYLESFMEATFKFDGLTVKYLYPCAVWGATLALSEGGMVGSVAESLVRDLSKKYGLIEMKNARFGNAPDGEIQTYLKTARGGDIVVQTVMRYDYTQTFEVTIVINAPKL